MIARLAVLLVFAHMLADYPLQGDFLAKAKNCRMPVPGVPWQLALASHAAIHAGFVFLITGSFVLALGELIAHALIDDSKCRWNLSLAQDQMLHFACKAFWLLALALWTPL